MASSEHLDILKRLRAEQNRLSREERIALLEKYSCDPERSICLRISKNDRGYLNEYRYTVQMNSLAETVRYLVSLSLHGEFPPVHLDIISRIALVERISDKARRIWEQEGCPDGKAEEIWHRAEAELRTR
jgi:DUF2934 family protein